MAQRKTTSATRQPRKREQRSSSANNASSKNDIISIRLPHYDFAAFEARWREQWEASDIYRAELHNAS